MGDDDGDELQELQEAKQKVLIGLYSVGGSVACYLILLLVVLSGYFLFNDAPRFGGGGRRRR